MLAPFLKSLGVQRIYFGSGGRNCPLLEELHGFQIIHGHDERSLAFRALGLAKTTRCPAVICTTSGTAVAECFAAVIEAYYTFTPLIVISADRPKRLWGSFAPQVIHQKNIFGQYVRSSFHQGQLSLKERPQFPMHINYEIEMKSSVTKKSTELFKQSHFKKIEGNGIVIVNTVSSSSLKSRLEDLFLKRKIPCFQEINSPFFHRFFPNEVVYDEQLIELLRAGEFDYILRIGETPNSKAWRLLDEEFSQIPLFHYSRANQPALGHGVIVPYKSEETLFSLIERIETSEKDFKDLNASVTELLKEFPQSEQKIFCDIIDQSSEDDVIFIGNSLPIRHLRFARERKRVYLANRGANGIDGLIATAQGVCDGTQKGRVHLIIGDLSFFYDFNALFQLPLNDMVIHVLNNGGGRIFDLIQAPKEIQNNHDLSLDSLHDFFQISGQRVIEWRPNHRETKEFHQRFNEMVSSSQ